MTLTEPEKLKMTLPRNFTYLFEGLVAGSAHPAYGGHLSEVLSSLEQEGFRAVLTLTEDPMEPSVLAEFGLQALHLPVVDFTAPTLQQIEQAVSFVRRVTNEGDRVLVHCHGGIGRTGTILACLMVADGQAPDEAIENLRKLRPGSVEVPAQEQAVHEYAAWLRGGKAGQDTS